MTENIQSQSQSSSSVTTKRSVTSLPSLNEASIENTSSYVSLQELPICKRSRTSLVELDADSKDTEIALPPTTLPPTNEDVNDDEDFGLSIDVDDDESDATTSPREYLPVLDASTVAANDEIDFCSCPGRDLRTGVIFEAGEKHFDPDNANHKERPIRILSIRQSLIESGLLNRCINMHGLVSISNDSFGIMKDIDQLTVSVHHSGYIRRLHKLSSCTCSQTRRMEADQYQSIYLTQHSLEEAKMGAGSLCHIVSQVIQGELDNGFAVIRPPGHHAEPSMAGGFCLVNNVAIAAEFAKQKLGLQRILIVDYDIHHGNGTQAIFLNDPSVLYFSVHRYQGGNFFPFLKTGGPQTVGSGNGAGFTINVGWSRKGMGDDEYAAVWQHVLIPVAREFEPELILVSAGFDGADGDLYEGHVSPQGFADMTQALMSLGTPVVCTLEGGYVRRVLSDCVSSVIRTLLDPNSLENEHAAFQDEELLSSIDVVAAKDIRSTIEAHQPYWNCFDKY